MSNNSLVCKMDRNEEPVVIKTESTGKMESYEEPELIQIETPKPSLYIKTESETSAIMYEKQIKQENVDPPNDVKTEFLMDECDIPDLKTESDLTGDPNAPSTDSKLQEVIDKGKINAKKKRRYSCLVCNKTMVESKETETKPAGKRMKTETATQRKRRLEKAKRKRQELDEKTKRAKLDKRKEQRQQETSEQREARLEKDRMRHLRAYAALTPEQRQARIERVRKYVRQKRASETPEQHQARIKKVRESVSQSRANETEEQHEARIEKLREYMSRVRNRTNETFIEPNNTFSGTTKIN